MGALKGKLCDWLVSKEKYPDRLKSRHTQVPLWLFVIETITPHGSFGKAKL